MHYQRIKDLREEADKNQKEVSQYLWIAERTYSSYETGTRQIPTDILCRLADYHHTSVDYLLGRTDEKKPYPPAK